MIVATQRQPDVVLLCRRRPRLALLRFRVLLDPRWYVSIVQRHSARRRRSSSAIDSSLVAQYPMPRYPLFLAHFPKLSIFPTCEGGSLRDQHTGNEVSRHGNGPVRPSLAQVPGHEKPGNRPSGLGQLPSVEGKPSRQFFCTFAVSVVGDDIGEITRDVRDYLNRVTHVGLDYEAVSEHGPLAEVHVECNVMLPALRKSQRTKRKS